jgi:hypothetical protein
MTTALAASLFFRFVMPFSGAGPVKFAKGVLATTAITTLVWIVVTFATRPESEKILMHFYRKVRPHAAGWAPIAHLAPDVPRTSDLGANLLCWMLGCVMVYAVLFGVGKLIFGATALGLALLALACATGWYLYTQISRITP